MSVDESLLGFIAKLRAEGVQISVAEGMDAIEALKVLPLGRPGALRSGLRATLVKNEADYPLFDTVFEEYFHGAAAVLQAEESHEETSDDEDFPMLDAHEITAMLRDVIASGNTDELMALARLAAEALGRSEGGYGSATRPMARTGGAGYYTFRSMEMLRFWDTAASIEEEAASGELMPGVPPGLAAARARERLEWFRLALRREIRRRLTVERGEQPTGKRYGLRARPDEVDFMSASREQLDEMQRILPSLARRLAARIARRQLAGRRGRVDVRSTIRHSLSSGGVPFDVRHRKRIPAKPELFILCDVSSSVRTFSTFTLQLVYSLHQQFRSVRSFAFIDRVDEVTDFFNMYDVGEAVERVYRDGILVDGDGHSDVGRAIELFSLQYGEEITPRSTVLILSDARNNMKDPREWGLARIEERARRVYWLNPEPSGRWNTGDSIMEEYITYCHSVSECRNLRQLADFVYHA